MGTAHLYRKPPFWPGRIILLIKAIFVGYLGYFVFYVQMPENREAEKRLNEDRARYEQNKIRWEKERIADSIETVRYCERVDKQIRELKAIQNDFKKIGVKGNSDGFGEMPIYSDE